MLAENKVLTKKKKKGDENYSLEDVILKVSKESQIQGLDEISEEVKKGPMPAIYNGANNTMTRLPNPFDNILSMLNAKVIAVETEGTTINNMFNSPEDYNLPPQFRALKSDIEGAVVVAYSNSIVNSIVSFLQYRIGSSIMPFFPNSNIDQIIGSYMIPSNIRTTLYELTDTVIHNKIDLARGEITAENAAAKLNYQVMEGRNRIAETVAEMLNYIARALVYGASTGRTNLRDFDVANYQARVSNMRDMFTELGMVAAGGNDNNEAIMEETFGILMCEFTVQLNAMIPMIEVLLFQVTAATDHLFSQYMVNGMINEIGNNKRSRQGRYDPYAYDGY